MYLKYLRPGQDENLDATYIAAQSLALAINQVLMRLDFFEVELSDVKFHYVSIGLLPTRHPMHRVH